MKAIAHWIARTFALVGGLVLVALVFVTCISVSGRASNALAHLPFVKATPSCHPDWLGGGGGGPIVGDFEIIEAGIAFALFSFLPWCQANQGHATVDIFTSYLSAGANRALGLIWEVVLTGAIWLITWRLYHGMLDKLNTNETTFLLGFPVWIAYAASLVAAVAASFVGVQVIIERAQALIRRRDSFASEPGAGH